ncbi:MAG: NADP-dependent phosphogluconate dehydrogenase [Flavobacteriaceae bacterium]|nr:MAG: NADP-dependent phosphogluconate dehydrogenase [Flavobacteriaceae bacterium]
MKSEFGIIGLGVMGKSLARNFSSKGFNLSLFNRHVSGKEENVAKEFIKVHDELRICQSFDDLEKFVSSLETPRKILIMVNAGEAIDSVISDLLDFIQPNDILIDGGNSHYKATNRRKNKLSEANVQFVGMGVSGGEEGALKGPSLMPGCDQQAYSKIEHYLKEIAAKDYEGNPCCRFIGNEGAGHFVKMVHNGIEYAEMQLIAEIYSILRYINKIDPNNISEILTDWNRSEIQNYLLESTAIILKKKTGDDYVLDSILDQASHKGTGAWTSMAAAELGVPFTMSTAALNARFISSLKETRVKISKEIELKRDAEPLDLNSIKHAYKLARIVNHIQGFMLIESASKSYSWNIDLKNVAKVWTNGCIIASKLMIKLANNLEKDSSLIENTLMFDQVKMNYTDLKRTVSGALQGSFPIPCLSESLNYINAITQADGVGNLIQAQRDFFGAHTYKLKDDPEGPSHHTEWSK